MANSSLQGKTIPIHKDVSKQLNKIFSAYNGNEDVEGYSRLDGLVSSNEISYEQLKRIKNFFDSFDGNVSDTSYLLNGGSLMKNWVNHTLKNARDGVKGKKKAMKDGGMDNQYIKNHSKDGVRIDPHDSDTNKIMRQEGIYNIGIMESLIKTIDKNKELWHKHHGK